MNFQRCLSVMLVQGILCLCLWKNKLKCPGTGRSPQSKPRRCTVHEEDSRNVNMHQLAHAQVLILYPCMCMHCPHAYFIRCLPCPCSPCQRKVFDVFAMAHICIKLVIRQSIRTSKTQNKCKLSITTLLSGIVGKSGALTTFHFLLDLGNFDIVVFSIVREPSLL